MRVTLRLELDCSPDDAWDALHAPAAMQYVMRPLLTFRMADGSRVPDRWEEGRGYVLRMKLFGLIPAGDERVEVTSETRGDARVLIDDGGPVSGALGVVSDWRHRMGVSPAAGGRTLYRDRLDVKGASVVAIWPVYWIVWQWRASRLKRLARGLPLP
jgi:hypothetical protein